MLISVIISTYNRPEALVAVLNGMIRQSDRNFEIVIADDGSDETTGDAVHAFITELRVPIQRIWQPHRGFRLAAVRNRAIAKSSGEYFVFLDGDCVPRPDFIARHRQLAERGHFVFGQRILLSSEFTDYVLDNNIDISKISFPALALARMRGPREPRDPRACVAVGPAAQARRLRLETPARLQLRCLARGPCGRGRIRRRLRGMGP